MDDLRRELIALLAAVIYLAGVQLLKKLRTWLDQRGAAPEAPEAPEREDAGTAEAQRWLDDLKNPDDETPDRPPDRST
ncbi:hypothetical protein [Streptomonospora salina]|uniref:Uncharacterized protein n=1 Tax=Streptomonospora salina TaxID=104205 RepID=A0A841E8B7_9ACTN|nr:hypothetical protein [Streptomonospora salina]MBB6000207.1 hypothetical protein [Streptomonospora salina]